MSRFSHLARTFNIEPGEERLVARLAAVAFFQGAALLFLFNTANAIFLANFDVSLFPLVFLATAIITIVLNRLLAFFAGRLSLRVYYSCSYAVAVLFILIQYAGLRFSNAPLFTFAVPILFGIVETAILVLFWSLVSRLFTIRQSKRLAGLISGGDTLAWMSAGIVMALLVPLLGTVNILLVAATAMTLALWLLWPLTRLSTDAGASPYVTAQSEAGTRAHGGYAAAIIGFIVLAVCLNYLINYLMYAQASSRFSDEDSLAAFFGLFVASYQLVTLLAVTLASGRLLSRFGLRFGLAITSIIGLLLIVVALVFVLIPELAGLLFWTVMVLKGVDWVLRNVFYFPSVRVLFAPLPRAIRLRTQVTGEGLGTPLGIGLASLLLLGLTRLLQVPLTVVLLVTGAVAVIWFLGALLLYPRYITKLRDAVQRGRLPDVALHLNNDAATLNLLRRNLYHSKPQVVLYALNQLRQLDRGAIPPALTVLADHTNPSIRRIALNELLQHDGVAEPAIINKCLTDTDSTIRSLAAQLAVRDEAGTVADWFAGTDEAVTLGALRGALVHRRRLSRSAGREILAQAAASASVGNRLLAATALLGVDRPELGSILAPLLDDPALEVRRQALLAAGHVGGEALWPLVADHLGRKDTGRFAIQALSRGGAATSIYLQDMLGQPQLEPAKLRHIATLCSRSASVDPIPMLASHQDHTHLPTRLVVLEALQKSGYRQPEEDVYASIDKLLAQASWLRQTHQCLLRKPELKNVAAALDSNLALLAREGWARLGLACGADTTANMRRQLGSVRPDQRAIAAELLLSLVPAGLGPSLLALLDDNSSSEPLFARYPQLETTVEEQLLTILGHKRQFTTAWLLATTIHALALPANALANNRLLAQAQALIPALAAELRLSEGRIEMFSQIEQIIALKATPFFAATDEQVLARVAAVLSEKKLRDGETLFQQNDEGSSMYIIVSGILDIRQGENSVVVYSAGDVVGELALIDSEPRSATAVALSDCELLVLDQQNFNLIVNDYPEIAGAIMAELVRRLRHTAAALEAAQGPA